MSGANFRSAILISLAATAIIAIGAATLFVHPSFARSTTYATPDEAAQAELEQIASGWPIVGRCDLAEPNNGEVCFTSLKNDEYTMYSAGPHGFFDIYWWVGVIGSGSSWKVFDSGPCGLGYCRITQPDGHVLSGWPDGDANCDRITNSIDALLVLQFVAGLVPDSSCYIAANVDNQGGVDALDALAILQAEAGLIPGLPLRI